MEPGKALLAAFADWRKSRLVLLTSFAVVLFMLGLYRLHSTALVQVDDSQISGLSNIRLPWKAGQLQYFKSGFHAKAEGSNVLPTCSSATYLGIWVNETFVPVPYDHMSVLVQAEQHLLSPEEMPNLDFDGVDYGSFPSVYPLSLRNFSTAEMLEVNADNATELPSTGLVFSPPCFYHWFSRQEIFDLLKGKWVMYIGDSNTRAIALALLILLDPSMRSPPLESPWDPVAWFGEGAPEGFPFMDNLDFYFAEDGSVVYKSARTIRTSNDPPLPPYSFRVTYRNTHAVWDLLAFTSSWDLIKGPDGSWLPDFMYFNSGNWDSFETRVPNLHYNSSFEALDEDYGRLGRLLRERCNASRQVCFWGTPLSNEIVAMHSKLCQLQWKQMAHAIAGLEKLPLAQRGLHILDRFWSSHPGHSSQRRGGHYSHVVNIWDNQKMLNIYAHILNGSTQTAKTSKRDPNRSKCIINNDGRTGRCDSLVETVIFEEDCVLKTGDLAEGRDGYRHMWARNCSAHCIEKN